MDILIFYLKCNSLHTPKTWNSKAWSCWKWNFEIIWSLLNLGFLNSKIDKLRMYHLIVMKTELNEIYVVDIRECLAQSGR